MERFDIGKQFIISTLICNNRLETYSKYLSYAFENGYKVCSMKEFWDDKNSSQKHFILRHDVDWNGIATEKMFETEKKVFNLFKDFGGGHSTYYFRHSTVNKFLINKMLNEGFEVGLHYETIADFANKEGITEFNLLPMEKIRECLKKEIKEFKQTYNPNLTSICSHGAPLNRKLHVSNNYLLENRNYSDFGIEFEAYDKRLYENFINCHIMDGTLRVNSGFSYMQNPIDAINSGIQNIVFLSHPNHWYFTYLERCKHLGGLLFKGIQKEPTTIFKRISDGTANI